MKFLIIYISLLPLLLASCNNSKPASDSLPNESAGNDKTATNVVVPSFNADSAYLYTRRQVDFGPRVPNTNAHKKCALYLSESLKRFGAEVTEQKANLKAFDDTNLEAVNIIGSYNPAHKTRILLTAHWDSRPFADNDPDPENHKTPVLGANDGASGVGVLLEVARQLSVKNPQIGIDIIFFDAEDYGQPYFDKREEVRNSWCLGSQYWARNPHVPNYRARYGILLDMVGAKNAVFPKDKISIIYAAHVVDKVWNKAHSLGYNNLFLTQEGAYITDDHVYINEIIGIPCIDIIHYENNSFFEYWHTVNDTMEHIDKGVLKAVGQTLLEVIYNEK